MKSVHELVKTMGGDDMPAAFQAKKTLNNAIFQATDSNQLERLNEIADGLVAELTAMTEPAKDERGRDIPPEPVHPPELRREICRLLRYGSGSRQVEAMASVLNDLDVREAVRCALDRNMSEEATKALITALSNTCGPDFRIGIVASLAKREGAAVLDALRQATQDDAHEVRFAAAELLANFPDEANDTYMVKVGSSPCPRSAARIAKARIRLAETLARHGKKSAARRIYQAVLAADVEPAKKVAAEIGLKNTG